MMIPVDRTKDDPFYRYKMPLLQTTHESNKTVLVNIGQIAKSLHRDPMHILKYIGMTIGCTSINDGLKYLVNGNFESKRLQTLIFDYIDLAVLCQDCGNLETRYVFDTVLRKSCSSCGAVIPQRDHKINNIIIKDIEKKVNEDIKYDVSNANTISAVLKEDKDVSDKIFEIFKTENLQLKDIFSTYFKSSLLKQFSKVLPEFKVFEIIDAIETMLENSKKEDKIQSFLKTMCKMGYSIDDIEEYFNTPRNGKKRSPLIKKSAAQFIAEFED